MKAILKKYYQNDFNRNNLFLFVGTLFISVFNYVYYPVLSRLVSVDEFGEIQALIAIFMQLGILLTASGFVVTNIVNNANKNKDNLVTLLMLERLTAIVALVAFVGIVISSTFLKDQLQFSSVIPLMLVGFLVLLNVPSTSRSYFLQGMRKMGQLSLSGIIFTVSKLVLSVIFILLGFSVIAVITAYIIAQSLSLLYLWRKTRTTYPRWASDALVSKKSYSLKNKELRQEVVYGVAIFVLLSGITLLYSTDTVLVRYFFSSYEAGMYSGISAIGRIVFFVTASVSGVLLATVRMDDSYQVNMKILKKSLLLVSAIGGAVAVVFSLFPVLSITILLGSEYAKFSALLFPISVMMLLCAYNYLLACYQIALRRFKAIYAVAASLVVFAVLVANFHATLEQIVVAYIASNALVLVLLSIQILKGRNYG